MSPSLPNLASRRVAVVTIDLHRGHLDPAVATMPLPAEVSARVVAANVELIGAARERNIPVVHVVTSYHGVKEIASNPWWSAVADTDATRKNVLRHQLPGSPGLDVMPEVLDSEYDIVVMNKKRYDCFHASELDHVLRSRGIDTILVTGVNTNSCVLATTVSGNAKDYAMVVVEECVDTMDAALHEAALSVIRQAFGWVATVKEVVAAL
ncbi:MAG: isochorismatase family cysteine hydrolase [Micromonospora sp.]